MKPAVGLDRVEEAAEIDRWGGYKELESPGEEDETKEKVTKGKTTHKNKKKMTLICYPSRKEVNIMLHAPAFP